MEVRVIKYERKGGNSRMARPMPFIAITSVFIIEQRTRQIFLPNLQPPVGSQRAKARTGVSQGGEGVEVEAGDVCGGRIDWGSEAWFSRWGK